MDQLSEDETMLVRKRSQDDTKNLLARKSPEKSNALSRKPRQDEPSNASSRRRGEDHHNNTSPRRRSEGEPSNTSPRRRRQGDPSNTSPRRRRQGDPSKTLFRRPPDDNSSHPLLRRVWDSEAAVMETYMRGVEPTDVVLDLASGVGFSTHYLAARYGCTALGVDLVPGIVTKALATYGSPRVKFMWGDMLDPHLFDKRQGAFAWVMCHHGIHYVTDMAAFLQPLWRALRPDGHLLFHYLTREFGDPPLSIAAVYRTMSRVTWAQYRQQLESTLTGPILTLLPEPGHWIKDSAILRGLLENNGFSVTACEPRYTTFTIPIDAHLIRAVFEAVGMLPEELQQRFVEDVVSAARELSGHESPNVTFYTAVIVARKAATS